MRESPGLRTSAAVPSDLEVGIHEQSVRLPGQAGAEADRVGGGHTSRERPQERGHRHRPRRLHPAPVVQALDRPERHLLERYHVRRVGGHQAHHLLQVERGRLRVRPPVVEVPAADEQAHGITLRACEGASSTSSSASSSCSSRSTPASWQDAQSALDAYNAASKDEAEELYGDYVDARRRRPRRAPRVPRHVRARRSTPRPPRRLREVFNRLARKRPPEPRPRVELVAPDLGGRTTLLASRCSDFF